MQTALDPVVSRHSRANRKVIYWGLFVLSLIGTAVRLWVVWRYNQRLPDTIERLAGDETGYDGLAVALLDGYFFQWPGRTPVYPLFLAAVYALFGRSFAIALYVQAFVGTLVVPLSFELARKYLPADASLVVAAVLAVHPTLILHTTRLYSEVLYTPLLLVSLLALLWAVDEQRYGRYFLAGMLLAVTNLCRPTAVFLPFLIPLFMPWRWSWQKRGLLSLTYLAGMVLVIAPWTVHNYLTYGVFMPLSVSTALLWQGSPEFYHLVQEGNNLLDIWANQLNPVVNGGYDPFSIEGDAYFTQRAIASILAEPWLYIRYVFQKMAYFWIGNPVIDWPYFSIFSLSAMREFFPWHYVAGVFASRLLPVVALGALISIRERWQEFWPLLAVCGYYMVMHGLTFAEVRYSEPLHPILVIIIVAAGLKWMKRARSAASLVNPA